MSTIQLLTEYIQDIKDTITELNENLQNLNEDLDTFENVSTSETNRKIDELNLIRTQMMSLKLSIELYKNNRDFNPNVIKENNEFLRFIKDLYPILFMIYLQKSP